MEKRKILILIDVQNDFITGSLENKEAQAAIPAIVEKIKNFDGEQIILTKDTHHDDYINTKEGEKLPVIHCIEGSDGWDIQKDVKDAVHAKGIPVTTFNKPTFGSLSMARYLDGLEGELDIEVCGFCTDICVVSNALLLKAKLYERANITVDASCCAGVTPETHKAALATMKMCQINVINE